MLGGSGVRGENTPSLLFLLLARLPSTAREGDRASLGLGLDVFVSDKRRLLTEDFDGAEELALGFRLQGRLLSELLLFCFCTGRDAGLFGAGDTLTGCCSGIWLTVGAAGNVEGNEARGKV